MKTFLIILGSPLWLPLLVVAAALVIVFYAVAWVLVGCFYILTLALALAAVGGVIYAFTVVFGGEIFVGVALIGAGAMAAGLGYFAFFGSLYSTKGMVSLTRKTADLKYLF